MKSAVQRALVVLVGVCSISLLSGCATIFSKSVYPVKFETAQPKEEIAILDHKGNEIFRGKTPTVVHLKARGWMGGFKYHKYQVLRYKNGQVVNSTTFRATLDPWWFGNAGVIVLAFPVSLIALPLFMIPTVIDDITGRMWKLADTVTVD